MMKVNAIQTNLYLGMAMQVVEELTVMVVALFVVYSMSNNSNKQYIQKDSSNKGYPFIMPPCDYTKRSTPSI